MTAAAVIAVLLILAAGVFVWVRWRVRRRPELRVRFLLAGAALSILAIVVGGWLPSLVSNSPGSPVATVADVLLWLAGALLLLFGAPLLLGAVLTAPVPIEPPKEL
jgi:hypothetical protein